MREYQLILPPMELQEYFATFVEQTDKSKFEIQKSLEKLETLKKALMQKYFG
jgi:type I restriction enzyme S subunit